MLATAEDQSGSFFRQGDVRFLLPSEMQKTQQAQTMMDISTSLQVEYFNSFFHGFMDEVMDQVDDVDGANTGISPLDRDTTQK